MSTNQKTLVVFHRCGGKSLGYPPNTILTINWALSYGAKAIEYDVVFCNDDGRPKIVLVEPKLLKEQNLDVNNLNYTDVVQINAGNPKYGFCKVPLLDEVLELTKGLVAQQIHIKGKHQLTIATLLLKLTGYKNFILTSFDLNVLKEIKKLNASIKIGWIIKPNLESGDEGAGDLTATVSSEKNSSPYTTKELNFIINQAYKAGVDVVILCGPKIAEKTTVRKVREAGFEVGAWGVGSNLELAKKLIGFNIDRFTLNNPEQLVYN